MIIVDTTVWIDYLSGSPSSQADWLDHAIERFRIGLTDIILCEVLQGVRTDRMFAEVEAELLRFEVFATGGTELAIAAARNYRLLRARGRTVRTTIDVLIATFCLIGGHALLHNDRDFDNFEHVLGLQAIHP